MCYYNIPVTRVRTRVAFSLVPTRVYNILYCILYSSKRDNRRMYYKISIYRSRARRSFRVGRGRRDEGFFFLNIVRTDTRNNNIIIRYNKRLDADPPKKK